MEHIKIKSTAQINVRNIYKNHGLTHKTNSQRWQLQEYWKQHKFSHMAWQLQENGKSRNLCTWHDHNKKNENKQQKSVHMAWQLLRRWKQPLNHSGTILFSLHAVHTMKITALQGDYSYKPPLYHLHLQPDQMTYPPPPNMGENTQVGI